MKQLGFGTMRLPVLNRDKRDSIDLDRFKGMVDTFARADSVILIRLIFIMVSRARRLSVRPLPCAMIAINSRLRIDADMARRARRAAERDFREQLKRCGVEYFDFY